jgi:anti-sigma-K factor RskA
VMQAVRDEPRSQSVRPRRRWFASIASTPRSALASAAVVAVVVLGVLAGVELSSSGTSGRVVQAQVSGISGTAQLRVADGRGELIVRRLTPPPAGHVYEVWLKAADAPPVPASVLFSVSASGSADVGLPGSLRGIGQVLVTPEPEGGSPQPTHAPVIVAPVT